MLSTNSVLFFSSPNYIPRISFPCLSVLARTSGMMWKTSDEKEYPYLVPDLNRKSSSMYVVRCKFLYVCFIKIWRFLHD